MGEFLTVNLSEKIVFCLFRLVWEPEKMAFERKFDGSWEESCATETWQELDIPKAL